MTNVICSISATFTGCRFSDWANVRPKDESAPKANCCSTLANEFLDGWELSGVTLYQSGTPFTVINSAGNTGISLTDNAGVSSGLGIAASYPDLARGLPAPASNSQSFGPLIGNPSQFVAPRGFTFGDAGRNYLNNPSRLNFDLAVLKHFKVISCYAGPSYSAGFQGSAANCVNGASFLHPLDAHRPRTIQFGLKLAF